MIASLSERGMLGVVVPYGVLFRRGNEGKIRTELLKHDLIEAVIGLAPNLFYGAGIPAAILILRKHKSAHRANKVLLVNGTSVFQPGTPNNSLSNSDIETLSRAVANFANVENLSRVVCRDESERNRWSLNVSRYVQNGPVAISEDIPAHTKRVRSSLWELHAAEVELNRQLDQLRQTKLPLDGEEYVLGDLVSIAKGGTSDLEAARERYCALRSSLRCNGRQNCSEQGRNAEMPARGQSGSPTQAISPEVRGRPRWGGSSGGRHASLPLSSFRIRIGPRPGELAAKGTCSATECCMRE